MVYKCHEAAFKRASGENWTSGTPGPCWEAFPFAFAIRRDFFLLHEQKVHPVLGPMVVSRAQAEEFSKVHPLEFYLALVLNKEAPAVTKNNCEINNSLYFPPAFSC